MTNAFHFAYINLPDGKTGYPHAGNGLIVWMSDDISVYYSGDTYVFGDMELVGEIIEEPDIAVLRYTMGSLEAAFAARLLKAKHLVPYHYGTMPTLNGTPDKGQKLTEDGPEIHVLRPGELLSTVLVKARSH